MPPIPAWGTLPPELWQGVFVALADSSLGRKRLDSPDWSHPWWCRTAAVLSSVSKGLHEALLGPQSALLWDQLSFASDLGVWTPRAPTINRWLAARAVHARSARVLGGGWSCADLRCVMAALSRSESLHTLRLECVHDVREAVCIDSELAGSSIRHLTFHGSHACQLPATLRSLELWIWPIGSINADKDELLTKTLGFAHLLHGVQPLPVLSSLLVTSYGWDLPGVDAQILAGSFPALQQLQIHMLLTPRARFTSDLKYLADLLPSVPVHLTVRAFACEVPRLLQQLQQVRLASLDLSCLRRWSHATGTDVLDAVEPLLAQCSVQQFTLRLDDSWPQGMRLCQEPHGVVVVYARADKWLALEAADVAWQLRSGA